MIDRSRNFIRHFAAGIMVRKEVKLNTPYEISLQNIWEDIHHCIVCWPEAGIDVMAAELVFRKLRNRFQFSAITVIALPGMGASPPDFGIDVFEIGADEFTFYGAPNGKLKSRLRGLKADLAVDLSPEYNPLSAYCCAASGARIRIGFATTEDEFVYNVQIAPNQERSGIDRYRVLATYIG
ncbi:MAG: hypothetical protein HN356_04090 [Calditrichaeota bacterium]|nr:hypothetical protein [Calditrichota bacterium]MBT7617403.1 hypothetical protein [Calditrichota bacterium]MBT7789332.1 hypothetical protein [Calditrichota bacterium]